MKRNFSSNLKGKVKNFSLPKDQPLIPLFEAIVNSINAIDEKRASDTTFIGQITISIIRDNSILKENDEYTILGFSVEDDGIGFNDNNMNSFMEADSEYKSDIGGKGVGRFSWLKAFSNAEIKSTFIKDNDFYSRNFFFSLEDSIIDNSATQISENNTGTIVRLTSFINNYDKKIPKDIDTIAIKIIQHCFIYFLRNDCPNIYLKDNSQNICLNDIFKREIKLDRKVNLSISNRIFELNHFKIHDQNFHIKNKVLFCADSRAVIKMNLEKFVTNLDSSIYRKEHYWYVGVLTGEYLDANVDMNRISFSFPTSEGDLFPNEPTLEEIENKVAEEVSTYLQDYLSNVEKEKYNRIQKFTTEKAPQYRHLFFYARDRISLLKPGLSDDDLDKSLYFIKREIEDSTKKDCAELFAKFDKGDISIEEYQSLFKNTVAKVCDINQSSLAEYVVHRRIILKLFEKGMNAKPDGKFQLEKYMHQLIYPMRSTSEVTPYEKHNLWLLDEKLSFCHFISSDKPFNNQQGEERADILVLDNPVVVSEGRNDGTAFNSIVIFELKRPGRNDYDMNNNPMTQLTHYAMRIRKGEIKDGNGRKIIVSDSTQMHLYAVCDITDTLDTVLNSLGYSRTPDGLGAYFYNQTLKAYIEVLSYDKIKNDSEQRNRVLFETLRI